jgi:hypothetical protein
MGKLVGLKKSSKRTERKLMKSLLTGLEMKELRLTMVLSMSEKELKMSQYYLKQKT